MMAKKIERYTNPMNGFIGLVFTAYSVFGKPLLDGWHSIGQHIHKYQPVSFIAILLNNVTTPYTLTFLAMQSFAQ